MKHNPVANIELIKQVNTASVYRLIDEQQLISRVKLAHLSELAPASITKMTRQLMTAGLIKEVAQQASTGGRPAISLTCATEPFVFISCNLGRNNITISLHNITGTKLHAYHTPLTGVPDNDVPLAKLLKQQFKVPAFIGNHTQSLSLAELYFGAAQDCQDSVLLSVHSGVGSGIINNGKIFTNYNTKSAKSVISR